MSDFDQTILFLSAKAQLVAAELGHAASGEALTIDQANLEQRSPDAFIELDREFERILETNPPVGQKVHEQLRNTFGFERLGGRLAPNQVISIILKRGKIKSAVEATCVEEYLNGDGGGQFAPLEERKRLAQLLASFEQSPERGS